jgi:hypothetical protein
MHGPPSRYILFDQGVPSNDLMKTSGLPPGAPNFLRFRNTNTHAARTGAGYAPLTRETQARDSGGGFGGFKGFLPAD